MTGLGLEARGAALARALLLVLFGACIASACTSGVRPTPGPIDPYRWFSPSAHEVLWDLYAATCEYEAEHGRAIEQPGWVQERAAADVATFVSGSPDYVSQFALAGLARLGLAGDTSRSDFPIGEVGDPFASSVSPLWRVWLERYLAALPEAERRDRFEVDWLASWSSAATTGNLAHLARLAEMLELTGYRDLLPDDGRADAWAALLAVRPDADTTSKALAAASLLERYGLPPRFDLGAWRSATADRLAAIANHALPLPHPYELEFALQRLQRL